MCVLIIIIIIIIHILLLNVDLWFQQASVQSVAASNVMSRNGEAVNDLRKK